MVDGGRRERVELGEHRAVVEQVGGAEAGEVDRERGATFHLAPGRYALVGEGGEVLRELGLSKGKIGCEMEYLAGKYVNQLMTDLPGLTLEPCEFMFRRARMFKTAREREIMKHGFNGTEKAMLLFPFYGKGSLQDYLLPRLRRTFLEKTPAQFEDRKSVV